MEARQALVDEVIKIDGKHVLVKVSHRLYTLRIATFSRRTTERIRRMMPGKRTRCALKYGRLFHAVE
jgi:hypothetical protein